MKTRTLAAIVIGLAVCGHAWAAPTTKQIMANVSKAYKSMKSLELSGTTVESANISGKKQSKSVNYTIAFQRPTKLRYEVKLDDGRQLVVSDGKNVYILPPKTSEYHKLTVEEGMKNLDGLSGTGMETMALLVGMDLSKYADNSKVIAEKKTGGIDCYVVQIKLDKDGKALQKLWVGKKDWLIRKNERQITISGQNGSGTVLSTSTVSSLRTNPSIKASTFVFNPPKGAKEFDKKKAAEKQRQMIQKIGDALHGKPAPAIALTDINGKKFSLASTKGKVVLLNFWVSSHPACKTYMPMLQKLYAANKGKGLEVVTVSADSKPQDTKAFASKHKLSYRILKASPQELQALGQSYRVLTVPTSYVINKSGNVVAHVTGPATEAQLKAALKKAGL